MINPINSDQNMRMKAAWNIIRAANDLGGYVFGGFVRDFISGDNFKDIDIYLPADLVQFSPRDAHKVKRSQFEKILLTTGCPELDREKSIYNEWLIKSTYSYYETADKSGPIIIDVVTSITPFTYKKGMDVDVNFVYMKKDKTIDVIPDMGLDRDTIFRHIKNREYDIPLDDNGKIVCPEHRIKHIEAKGYKRIKSKVDNVCSECNGAGILDFLFYKRICSCKLR